MPPLNDSNSGRFSGRLRAERHCPVMAEPVKYDRPPVVELVFGVLLKTPTPIMSGHVGRFWEQVVEEFPTAEDVPPIDPILEAHKEGGRIGIEISNLPRLRRTWLIAADGRSLIQIQSDRFLFNWKRESFEITYPSYGNVIESFEARYEQFKDFLDKAGVGKPSCRQLELTYVNHITDANGLSEVLQSDGLVDQTRRKTDKRFLPEPDDFNWRTSYQLPKSWGHLHVAASTANLKSTGEKIVRLDLMARGVPDNPETQRREWFDLGHEWITRGFTDITSDRLHKIWGRTA